MIKRLLWEVKYFEEMPHEGMRAGAVKYFEEMPHEGIRAGAVSGALKTF